MSGKLIKNQKSCEYASKQWGKYGTTALNGCGWIAAYNLLSVSGIDAAPDDVRMDLQALHAPLFSGKLGTNPFKLIRYLRVYFEKVNLIFRKKTIREAYASCGRLIVGYMYLKPKFGAHYVCVSRYENKADIINDTVTKRTSGIEEYFEQLKKQGCRVMFAISAS
jgi:hypothetical protein